MAVEQHILLLQYGRSSFLRSHALDHGNRSKLGSRPDVIKPSNSIWVITLSFFTMNTCPWACILHPVAKMMMP